MSESGSERAREGYLWSLVNFVCVRIADMQSERVEKGMSAPRSSISLSLAL
jgi:hypothetical protein